MGVQVNIWKEDFKVKYIGVKDFSNEINYKNSNLVFGRRHSKPFANCFVGHPVYLEYYNIFVL